MKKLMIVMVMVAMITGCRMFQLTETQEVAGSILARRVGHSLAIGQPEMAERLAPIAEIFVAGTGSTLTLDTFVSILTDKIDNPLLQADIKSLSRLIKIKGLVITIEEMKPIKAIMAAFLQGIRMGRK